MSTPNDASEHHELSDKEIRVLCAAILSMNNIMDSRRCMDHVLEHIFNGIDDVQEEEDTYPIKYVQNTEELNLDGIQEDPIFALLKQ